MPKQPTSVRLPDMTMRQLTELIASTGMTQSELITTAIDRMYQQEKQNMNTIYTVTNERYSNEPVEVTLSDLQQLVVENDWHTTLTETYRNGKRVIVDQHGDIVAESE